MERRHAEEAKRLYGSYFSNQQQQQQQPSFRDLELQNELNEIKSRLKLTEDQLKQEREDFSISKMQVRLYHSSIRKHKCMLAIID